MVIVFGRNPKLWLPEVDPCHFRLKLKLKRGSAVIDAFAFTNSWSVPKDDLVKFVQAVPKDSFSEVWFRALVELAL